MNSSDETSRLKIYMSSTDKLNHNLLGESLLLLAHQNRLAGATLSRGIMGYGSSSVIHSYKFWEVSEKVPLILEIVDNTAKLLQFWELIKPQLEGLPNGTLATIEKIDVLLYKAGKSKS